MKTRIFERRVMALEAYAAEIPESTMRKFLASLTDEELEHLTAVATLAASKADMMQQIDEKWQNAGR